MVVSLSGLPLGLIPRALRGGCPAFRHWRAQRLRGQPVLRFSPNFRGTPLLCLTTRRGLIRADSWRPTRSQDKAAVSPAWVSAEIVLALRAWRADTHLACGSDFPTTLGFMWGCRTALLGLGPSKPGHVEDPGEPPTPFADDLSRRRGAHDG